MHHSHGIISQISDVHLGFTQDHNTVAPLNNSKSRTTSAQSAQHWGLKAKENQHVVVHQWQSEKICLKRHVQLYLFVSVVHVLSSGLMAKLS